MEQKQRDIEAMEAEAESAISTRENEDIDIPNINTLQE